jgi:hypothetical protein
MTKLLFKFLCPFFLCPLLVASAEEIDLLAALQQSRIKATAQAKGGYQGPLLQLDVQNLGAEKLLVKVPVGLIFNSINDWEQDLIVTQEVLLALLPKSGGQAALYIMCIQSGNASPGKNAGFRPDRMAEPGLLKLVQHIGKQKYQNSTAQSAVWAVANGGAMADIYGQDPIMTKSLCALVSEATGLPCTEANYRARPHHITSVRTSLEVRLAGPARQAELGLFDQNGALLRTYWANQALAPGFYQFKLGVYHTLGDSAKVYLRLREAGQLLAERLVTTHDTIVRLQKLPETTLAYDLPQDVVARAGIYDEADQLYVLLQDDLKLAKGFHRSEFLKATEVPLGKTYFFKLKVGDQTVAQQQILTNRADKEKFAPMTKRGTFTFRLAQPVNQGKIAVYDPDGEVVWLVYAQANLSPGTKQVAYAFQHRRGRGSTFWLRLTDAAGNILAEQMVTQP